MSEPEERDRLDGDGAVEDPDKASSAEFGAALRAGPSDVEVSDLPGTGVGLSVGEPNTFEPEEAGPAAQTPAE